jgi:hypothetical protein
MHACTAVRTSDLQRGRELGDQAHTCELLHLEEQPELAL